MNGILFYKYYKKKFNKILQKFFKSHFFSYEYVRKRWLIIKEDKIILITGSTDGIGYQSAIELVKSGYHIIVHGRNQEKAELTLNQIEKVTNKNNLSAIFADLGSFNQIKEMVNDINDRYNRLDVLINNAGVYRPERNVTQEGLEETFAINYVAPFLLTNLLINKLKKGIPSRIVNVASRIQSNHFDFDDLLMERGYTGMKAYARSKTALILFTYFLSEKMKNTGITINSLHPGWINTKLSRSGNGSGGAPLLEGAKTLIYAATAPELENISGRYFKNNHPTPSKDITYNKDIQKKLWKITEELVGMEFKLL
ncbi:MAG: SDR family oxidoreductase [Promethearchaeota archaeon]